MGGTVALAKAFAAVLCGLDANLVAGSPQPWTRQPRIEPPLFQTRMAASFNLYQGVWLGCRRNWRPGVYPPPAT